MFKQFTPKTCQLCSLLLLVSIAQAQEDWTITYTCYETDSNGNKIEVPCTEEDLEAWNWASPPSPTENIDSICQEMETLFFHELNEWRLNNGLHALKYDDEMDVLYTTPHNEYQLMHNKIEHAEYGIGTQEITRSRGIGSVYECVALNGRGDLPGKSYFFNQYQKSKPHWAILTSEVPTTIACSVLYDIELYTFYSTVNLR